MRMKTMRFVIVSKREIVKVNLRFVSMHFVLSHLCIDGVAENKDH